MTLTATLHFMDSLPFAALIVVKMTVVLVAAAGTALILRRRAAALRHLVWSLAIAGVIALPLAMAFSPVTWHLRPLPASVDHDDDGVRRTGPLQGSAFDSPAMTPTLGDAASPLDTESRTDARGRPSWAAILIAGWALGTLMLLVRFLVGLWRVNTIARRATPVTDEPWLALADRLTRDPASPVELRVSSDVDMPFAAGLMAPAIVLPASSRDWTDERREAVLLHELAHLSRGDLFMNALSHLARALYWFHPLAWYASHRLRIECERACDDAVLRHGARASDYAGHLLSIASRAAKGLPTAALALARPSAFEGRLLAILEPGLERVSPSRWRVAATTAAYLAFMLPLAAASPTARAAAMTSSQEPDAQVATTETLARASSAVPVLVEALGDASAAVRLAAVNSLGSLEDPRAIAALGKALKDDSDPRVRRAAAEALGQIDDARAVPHLLDALKTERVADVREEIVQSLGEIDDPSAVNGIIAVTKDPSAGVRRAAVAALGDFEDQAALPAIMALARDEDVEVRRHVAEALGDLENPASLDALVTLARDSDAEVRSSAVNALGNLEEPRALNALVAALRDAHADVRSNAADAIHNIPDMRSAPRALIDALADPEHEVRHNVAHALGGIGDEAAVPALKRALSDSNADVRRAVAEALSEIGGAEAITALMGLLKDQDPEVRRIAAEALGKRR